MKKSTKKFIGGAMLLTPIILGVLGIFAALIWRHQEITGEPFVLWEFLLAKAILAMIVAWIYFGVIWWMSDE